MTGFKQIPFRNLEPGEAFLVPNKTDNHLQIFLKLAEEVIELGINSEDVPRRNAISLFLESFVILIHNYLLLMLKAYWFVEESR